MKKTTDAQLKASRKWQNNNKEQMNRIRKKSATKNFIKKEANTEELIEFEDLIKIRKNELNNGGN